MSFHVNIGPFEDQLLGVGKKLPISQVLLEDSNLPCVSHALARVIFGLVPAHCLYGGKDLAANVTDPSRTSEGRRADVRKHGDFLVCAVI